VLICNYVTRIIEPLASRCAKFRFQALPPDSMKERLYHIAQSEDCPDEVLKRVNEIVDASQGDMRRAVTVLQSIHSLAVGGNNAAIDKTGGGNPNNALITSDVIAEIAGLPPTYVMDTVWKSLQSGQYDRMQKAVQAVLAEGYAGALLVTALLMPILESTALTELHKAKLAIRMAEAEKKILEGADEYMQLMTVTSLAVTCFAQCRSRDHAQ
jgi:replication factor C subunit 2/4